MGFRSSISVKASSATTSQTSSPDKRRRTPYNEAKGEPEPEAEKAAMPKQKDRSRQHRRQMGELKKHWYDDFEDIPKLNERIDA